MAVWAHYHQVEVKAGKKAAGWKPLKKSQGKQSRGQGFQSLLSIESLEANLQGPVCQTWLRGLTQKAESSYPQDLSFLKNNHQRQKTIPDLKIWNGPFYWTLFIFSKLLRISCFYEKAVWLETILAKRYPVQGALIWAGKSTISVKIKDWLLKLSLEKICLKFKNIYKIHGIRAICLLLSSSYM
jgi:hypothetical protein